MNAPLNRSKFGKKYEEEYDRVFKTGKPKTIFAIRVPKGGRLMTDLYHLSLILLGIVIAMFFVCMFQYALCQNKFPEMGFKDCMTKNIFQESKK